MLISFKKSDKPYWLINTNQIVKCTFEVQCEKLQQNLPPFINVNEGCSPLCRCIDKKGKECWEHKYANYKTIDTPEGMFMGEYHSYKGKEVIEPNFKLIESDVPYCKLTIYYSAAGASVAGCVPLVESFVFYGLKDFLAAIDAIKEYEGIHVVE